LSDQRYDLILADYKLPAFDGLTALEIARDMAPETPFIFVSATLGEEVAIETLKNGATDYVVKSRLNRLASCVQRALAERAEVMARRRAEAAARDAQKRLSAAMKVAQIGAFEWKFAAGEIVLDERSCAIFGLPVTPAISTEQLRAIMVEEDRAALPERFAAAREARERVERDFRIRLPNGLARSVAAVCDWFETGDDVVGIGVFQDISDRKRAEDEQKLVVRELHHRVKNSLATVQAVITFSLRHARSLEAFQAVIYKRIDALARSHSFLTDDQFGGLLLDDMLMAELGAYGSERIELVGPAVYLNSELAMTFSLAIHELSTNAAKYGSLSDPNGRLTVRWRVEGRRRAASCARLDGDGWPAHRERTGPSRVRLDPPAPAVGRHAQGARGCGLPADRAAPGSEHRPAGRLTLFGSRPFGEHPIGAREVAGIAIGNALEIILVLGLGFPEIAHRLDLGNHFAGPNAGRIHIGYGVESDLFLAFVFIIDRRAVAGADVIALAICGGGIVDLEEELQNLAIGRRFGIENDLDGLGMGAVIAIGRVGHVAARIAHAGPFNAGELADQILHTPETATGQNCAFAHDTTST
jgi:PAS domain S-box-containing protein